MNKSLKFTKIRCQCGYTALSTNSFTLHSQNILSLPTFVLNSWKPKPFRIEMVFMKKKAKKIGKEIAKTGIIESIKWGFRRLLRRKPSEPEVEVSCQTVDRFKFFLNEFEELFHRTQSYNIISIIHSVCSPFANSSEINKEIRQLENEYKWVESKFRDAKDSLKNFEKYGEREWFTNATEHLYDALEYYVKCARPLDELLLAHSKPQTLKTALQTIDRYYVPMRERFNYLICELHRLSRMSEHVHFNVGEKYDILLPDIPSKKNLVTLLKGAKEEIVTPQ